MERIRTEEPSWTLPLVCQTCEEAFFFTNSIALHDRVQIANCRMPALEKICSLSILEHFGTAKHSSKTLSKRVRIATVNKNNSNNLQIVPLVESPDSLSKRNLWFEALRIAQQGFPPSQPPVVFIQKVTDIYLSLSKQSSCVFLLENFWPLAQRIVGRIHQVPDDNWNKQSIQAVLRLADYICAQHKEAEQLLFFLIKAVSYKTSTLTMFIEHLNEKHDEISVLQIDTNRRIQTLIEQVLFQESGDVSDFNIKTTLFVELQEIFSGGEHQPIPAGLLQYVKQYAVFLKNILAESQFYSDQDQVALFEPHFRSQYIRFTILHDSLQKTFERLTPVLSYLYEQRPPKILERSKK